MPNLPISGLPNPIASTDADIFVTVQGGVTRQIPLSQMKTFIAQNINLKDAPSGYTIVVADRGAVLLSSAPSTNSIMFDAASKASATGAGWATTIKANAFPISLNPALGDTLEGVPNGDFFEIGANESWTFISDGISKYYAIGDSGVRNGKTEIHLGEISDFDFLGRFTAAEVSSTLAVSAHLQVVGGYENDRFVKGDLAIIYNSGAFDIKLKTNSLATVIGIIPAGKTALLVCLTAPDTASPAGDGTWRLVTIDDNLLPLFTPARVPFAGGDGILKESGIFNWDSTNEQLVLGSNAGSSFLQVQSRLRTITEDANNGRHYQAIHYRGAGSSNAIINLTTCGGTEAAPVITPKDSILGNIVASAYDGSLQRATGAIRWEMDGAFVGNVAGTDCLLSRQRLSDPAGNVTTFLTGYATGVTKIHTPLLINDTSSKGVVYPADAGNTSSQISLINNTGTASDENLMMYGNQSNPAIATLLGSNGTFDAPTSLGVGDTAGALVWRGYTEVGGANAFLSMGVMLAEAEAAPTAAGIYSSVTISASGGDGNNTSFMQLYGNSSAYSTGYLNLSGAFIIDDQGSVLEASSRFTVNYDPLDVKASIPAPRGSTAIRNSIASPVEGMQWFNTDNHSIEWFDGAKWNGPALKDIDLPPSSWSELNSQPSLESQGNAESGYNFADGKQLFTTIRLPANYTAGTNLAVTLYLAARTVGVGSMIFNLQNNKISAGNQIAGAGATVQSTTAAPGVAEQLVVSPTFSIVGTTFAPGDLVSLRLEREPTGTYGDRVYFEMMNIKYT